MTRRLPTLLAAAAMFATGWPTAAAAVELRVATWNVANLHHRENWALRKGIGTRRTAADFKALQRYAQRLDADVIALQEIGTKVAAQKIFGKGYEIQMSGRARLNQANGIHSGIYTAIAVRTRDDIRIVRQRDLRQLSVSHNGGATRRGTGLLLDVGGTELWVLSVHLKSGCSGVENADTSNDRDCKTLWRQRGPLRSWIEDRHKDDTAFVIAGDFNRRFRQFDDPGPFWRHINGTHPPRPNRPFLDMHPKTVERKCPTRKGKGTTEPIDFILLNAEIKSWFKQGSFWETRFSAADVRAHGGVESQRLSDHCPIHVDLEW